MLKKQKKLESGKPSKTAEFMALFRALESTYPRERRLFEDPFAKHFLSPLLKAVTTAAKVSFVQKAVVHLLDTVWSGARASGICRTRLIDDLLQSGIHNSVGQIVILGAGYDSRALRIDGLQKLRVFEVDHPSTLHAKKKKLAKIPELEHGHVRYVETDFNSCSAEKALRAAGFQTDVPAFFIWEGVTNYLTEEAVRQTLSSISALAKGTLLAFTYVHRDAVISQEETVAKGVSKLLKRQGEPWTFGILPQELPLFLQDCGLRLLNDMDADSYRKKYLSGKGRHLEGYAFYHVALAEV